MVFDNEGLEMGLRVQPKQTLGLVGGDVALEGGFLTIEGGRIELGSVASNSIVNLSLTNQGYELDYENVREFQDINLSQEAFVNTVRSAGGDIQIQGRQITLSQGSQIVSVAQAKGQVGDLTINGSELVKLEGSLSEDESTFTTGVFNEVEEEATGVGKTLAINTKELVLREGAQISTTSSGTGQGVNLEVRASESIKIEGISAINSSEPSGMFARVNEGATGNGGTLTIEAKYLSISNGAIVSTRTNGVGRAGSLKIDASEKHRNNWHSIK